MILISLFKAIQSWFGSWRLIVFHKRPEQRRMRLTCRRRRILLLFKQLLPRCRLWVNFLPSIGNYSKFIVGRWVLAQAAWASWPAPPITSSCRRPPWTRAVGWWCRAPAGPPTSRCRPPTRPHRLQVDCLLLPPTTQMSPVYTGIERQYSHSIFKTWLFFIWLILSFVKSTKAATGSLVYCFPFSKGSSNNKII